MNKFVEWYIIVGIVVMISDATALHNEDFSIPKAFVLGLFDGIIWPFRIGYDLVVMILNAIGE